MKKKIRLTIEVEVGDYKKYDLDENDVFYGLTLEKSDIIDGYELTTDIDELDNTVDYIIKNAKIVNKEFINEEKRVDVKELNTLNSFYDGFKIIRDGQVITLTREEMVEFAVLNKASWGRGRIERQEESFHSNGDLDILKKLKESKLDCYGIEEDFLREVFYDVEETETKVISDYVNRMKLNKKEG